MKLTIDNREAALIRAYEQIATADAPMTVGVLPIGDIQLRFPDDQPAVLFERKTFADLEASIRDGRYDEQSFRLRYSGVCAPHNVVYVIEGRDYEGTNWEMIESAMASLHFHKGFSVMRTDSVSDTARLILQIARKLGKEHGKRPLAHPNGGQPPQVEDESQAEEYACVVKAVKKDNISRDNIGAIMLRQVPGVSGRIATAIMARPDVRGSIDALIQLLKRPQVGEKPRRSRGSKPGAEDVFVLSGVDDLANTPVPIAGATDKSVRVGPAVAARLASLLAPPWVEEDQSPASVAENTVAENTVAENKTTVAKPRSRPAKAGRRSDTSTCVF